MVKRPSIIDRIDLASPDQPEADKVELRVPAAQPSKKAATTQHTSIYVPRAAHDRLREIAFAERCKIHDLLMEGVDRVIASRGHSETATRKT